MSDGQAHAEKREKATEPRTLLTGATRFFHDAHQVLEKAQREYADPQNAFADFEATAALAGITREQALLAFFFKHMRGIASHVRGNTLQREGVRGRLIDAVNYLAILEGMIAEAQQ